MPIGQGEMAANPEQVGELKKSQRNPPSHARTRSQRLLRGVKGRNTAAAIAGKKRATKEKRAGSGGQPSLFWKSAGQFQRIAADYWSLVFGLGWWFPNRPMETKLVENDPVWIEKTTGCLRRKTNS